MDSNRSDFRSAVLDDRMQLRRRSRVRVASESAAALKGPPTKSRSRLLSESVAGSSAKAAEGPSKATLASIASGFRLGLHSHAAPSVFFGGQSKVVKEERKCVLRSSERKYEAIEDPEEVLLRYVLVSNAMRNLQIKMRREKAVKRASMGNKAFTRL